MMADGAGTGETLSRSRGNHGSLGNKPAAAARARDLGPIIRELQAAGYISRRLAVGAHAGRSHYSNGLRQFLSERGTQPVIPNKSTRKRFHTFDADTTSAAISSSACSVGSRTGAASPLATTSWPPTSQPSPSPPSSLVDLIESGT
jgi:hypothetical protein